MNTELAFLIMIHERGIHRVLGVAQGTVGKWRHNLKKGCHTISLDQKLKLLQRAGFFLVQDMKWSYGTPASAQKAIDYLNDFPGLTLIGKKQGLHDEVIRQINKSIVENPAKFWKVYRKAG